MVTGVSFSPEPPASPAGSKVAVGTWWPEIDVNLLRDTMRIGGTTIAHGRLTEAIQQAMLSTARELREWKLEHQAEGRATLAAVPAEEIGTETELTLLWRRAVFAATTADLMETHSDLMAKPAGLDRQDENYLTAADHRRNWTHAIRDILGVTRTAVELI